jgi:hypothetical protein
MLRIRTGFILRLHGYHCGELVLLPCGSGRRRRWGCGRRSGGGGRRGVGCRAGLVDGRQDRLRGSGVLGLVDEGDGLGKIQAGATEELVDDGLRQAACVILDAYGVGLFVELHAADAVDIAHPGEGEDGVLRGLIAVAEQDVELSHMVLILAELAQVVEDLG